MNDYLIKKLDYLLPDITNSYDELPLWSAPFGLLILNHFPIGNYTNYLDIGCATGFPLLEIAQRLGNACSSVGIDPWTEAVKRARFKINALGLQNVSMIESDASKIEYPDEYFDLITSNLGVNNFENPKAVVSECFRVLKTSSSFCLTTNLSGTFNEFYEVFVQTIHELGLDKYANQLEEHIKHRGTRESTHELILNSGFEIKKEVKSEYIMRFFDGSSFLNHSFTIVGFIDSWRNMFEENEKEYFFNAFERNLNALAKKKGELKLSIPMLYMECIKP